MERSAILIAQKRKLGGYIWEARERKRSRRMEVGTTTTAAAAAATPRQCSGGGAGEALAPPPTLLWERCLLGWLAGERKKWDIGKLRSVNHSAVSLRKSVRAILFVPITRLFAKRRATTPGFFWGEEAGQSCPYSLLVPLKSDLELTCNPPALLRVRIDRCHRGTGQNRGRRDSYGFARVFERFDIHSLQADALTVAVADVGDAEYVGNAWNLCAMAGEVIVKRDLCT